MFVYSQFVGIYNVGFYVFERQLFLRAGYADKLDDFEKGLSFFNKCGCCCRSLEYVEILRNILLVKSLILIFELNFGSSVFVFMGNYVECFFKIWNFRSLGRDYS